MGILGQGVSDTFDAAVGGASKGTYEYPQNLGEKYSCSCCKLLRSSAALISICAYCKLRSVLLRIVAEPTVHKGVCRAGPVGGVSSRCGYKTAKPTDLHAETCTGDADAAAEIPSPPSHRLNERRYSRPLTNSAKSAACVCTVFGLCAVDCWDSKLTMLLQSLQKRMKRTVHRYR